MGPAWKAWRVTITAIVALLAIGSLASANPSLRPPRGPQESGATGPSGVTGLVGTTGSEIELEPAGQGVGASGETPDFTACEGKTGLDNAICRHDALLGTNRDNDGLLNSRERLEDNKAKHEPDSIGAGGSGEGSPADGATTPGRSGEPHGNAGGNGGGNGKGTGNGAGGGNGR